jgi:methyl-accepting chemotaxis protein
MSLESKNDIHETLQFFLEHASTIKQLFNEDVDVTITDREKVLEHLQSKEINVDSSKGRVLKSDEPIKNTILSNKRIALDIPKEYYGTPFTAIMVPIHGNNGEVIGGIAVSKSTHKQAILMEVAEKFAASSEEISATTEELALSSSELSKYMNQLSTAQNEMHRQVETTARILDMINTVAKNTRVLGFNAGIEAARSGESGRGFSVVAKEITKLADQSASSVNEIKQLLDELNEKVDHVANIVNDTVHISTIQTTAIEEISQAIQHLTGGAEEIEALSKKI